jgi:hypothetical protein
MGASCARIPSTAAVLNLRHQPGRTGIGPEPMIDEKADPRGRNDVTHGTERVGAKQERASGIRRSLEALSHPSFNSVLPVSRVIIPNLHEVLDWIRFRSSRKDFAQRLPERGSERNIPPKRRRC